VAFSASFAEEVDRPLGMVAERLSDVSNYVAGAFGKNSRLIGVATLRREAREKIDHKASIFGVYVLPEYRSRGVGRLLMETLIDRAGEIGLRQVNLSVNNASLEAVSLYESCGFERFGLEKDAMKIGGNYFDAAYMVLRLG
jgi:ribosomal protein S18 acetylase RimI-like enzyme